MLVSYPRSWRRPHTVGMTQLPHADKVARWRDAVQLKLMAALDAAWRVIETSDDPAQVRQARDKARACGDLAACVRKVAALAAPRPPGKARTLPPPGEDEALAAEIEAAAMVAEVVGALPTGRERKLGRLKGGRRGRL
jgi:hypothetical protein